ncbi:AAA-like domain-containing protein [Moorena sp. SIO3A2]|uniref:AAA-like domain-containing protein n=1 Tax=Moorena sp. SIO3A2 TaxID=2607841 RepID=UPI0013B63252|nr:AAA-like domain-containing protein [Moorena sp. SIO3A2]NER88411.1 hypothetical protein [Moorena sp. SIO3A2]
MDTYEYQVGGSLKLNAPSYVERRADAELYNALIRGEFCYVFNSRQMGKSSLRLRIKHRLQQAGFSCASIDMTRIGSETITPQQWYKGLVVELLRNFKLYRKVNLKTWWREHDDLSEIQRLSQVIEEILLVNLKSEKIFIFIDEIDSVISLNFPTDDFFALIRSCYNQRAENPDYNRLTFALFGVATPSDLISQRKRTPFNIGNAIDLHGFTLEEAQPLASGLVGLVENHQTILKEILAWTGGQPFLTQKLCYLVQISNQKAISGSLTIPPGTEGFWLEQLVRKEIIENWEANDQPEHLRTLRERILRNEQGSSRLLALYQEILQQGEIAADDTPEQIELRLSGLVVKEPGQDNKTSPVLRVYNPIYQSIFNQDWVEQKLGNLRPYNQALNAWLASNREDNSRLLRGQALAEALNWKVGKRLSVVDDEFLAACQELSWVEQQRYLEAERAKEAEARLAEQKKSARRLKFLLMAVGTALMVSTGLGVTTYLGYRRSAISEMNAIAKSSAALFASNQQLDALVEAIRAKQRLKSFGNADQATETQVESVLRQAVYGTVEYNRLVKHSNQVWAVAINQAVNLIATASYDKTIKLWTLDGKLISTLNGHQAGVYDIAISLDGNLIASASDDKTVKLWKRDSQGTFQPRPYKTLNGHQAGVYGVAISPDSQMIASGSGDKTVKLWKADGTLITTLKDHSATVYGVAISPDGQTIASASGDKTVKLWGYNGKLLRTFQGHNDRVYNVAISPDGQTIASASGDKTVRLWGTDGTLLNTLQGHSDRVYNLAISPDGKTIASASWDGTVNQWSWEGTLLTTLRGHQDLVYGVAISPDEKTIASASWDGTVRLWKPDGIILTRLRGHSDLVWAVAISPDGKTIASASWDHTVKLWNKDGSLQTTLTGHSARVSGIAISPDGEMIASASADNTIKLWHRNGSLLKTLTNHTSAVLAVVFSSDGEMIASASADNTIKLWKQDGTLINTLKGHSDRIDGVAFSKRCSAVLGVSPMSDCIKKDGTLIASASWDKTVKLWKPDGTLITTLKGHHDRVYSVAISPDGETIASASWDKTIKLWKRDGTLITTLNGHQAGVLAVVFSPDGNRIASASYDKTVKLWKQDGTLLTTLKGHSDGVLAVVFSPNGEMLASASGDNTVIIWDLDQVLDLDQLLIYGCNWIQDYLNTNSEVNDVCHPFE